MCHNIKRRGMSFKIKNSHNNGAKYASFAADAGVNASISSHNHMYPFILFMEGTAEH